MSEANKAFQVPPEMEAALRARAEALVAAELPDESVMLAQFVAEAKAKRLADLRAQAELLSVKPAQNYDAHGFPEEYVEIMIYKGHGKTELSYVPVGVNGFFWKIARGTRVVVPKVVMQVLENAIGEEVVQAEGGLITQPVHRFPYQVTRDDVPKTDYLKARAAGKAAAVSQVATATA